MLANCANPTCSASFRLLVKGRLFRLEADPVLGSSKSSRMEYFWLCHRCSSTLTLRLREDGTVTTILLPKDIQGVPDRVALASVHRQEGLWLRTVSFSLQERIGDPARTRLKDRYHAA